MYELVFLGLALMVAPVLAKTAGMRGRHDFIGVGGLFFLVAAVTHIPLFTTVPGLLEIGKLLHIVSQGLGVILLGIGVLRTTMEVVPILPMHAK